MKEEIRNKDIKIKERIKTLEENIVKLRTSNDELLRQGQQVQQSIAQNNTNIIKLQGGLEELRKQVA